MATRGMGRRAVAERCGCLVAAVASQADAFADPDLARSDPAVTLPITVSLRDAFQGERRRR